MPDISEQNVIVSGANRGIGRVIVEQFVSRGAHVSLLGRRRKAVEETIEEILKELDPPGSLTPIEADVTEPQVLQEALSSWIDEHDTVHTLVNNAGITRDGLLMRTDLEDWDTVLDTNLGGVFFCTRGVVRNMVKNRWGRIIMISSVSGIRGNPGQTNYAASKSGMIGFCKSVARELGSRNITCNTVAPGYIETELTEEMKDKKRKSILENTPIPRPGKAEDVADCVMFLAGETSSYITGEVIRVDGGFAT